MGLLACVRYRTGQSTAIEDYPSSEHWARAMIVAAFKAEFGREPTLLEAQFAQAVSRGESNYGRAAYVNQLTGEKHVNTWNMGGVQCGTAPPCPANCFEATDTREDGTPYQWCFRRYDSPVEGFAHFIKVLYVNRNRKTVLEAANTGSIEAFSTALRASGYFELALDKHILAMTTNLQAITTKLGESMPSESGDGLTLIVGTAVLATAGYIFYSVVA